MLDEGEVETVAHYYAAAFFDPDVDCILDIGGQDMKCIKIKNQTVDSVQLNEACSSGCGSFIETFAKSLNYTVAGFREGGALCRAPHRPGHPLYRVHELQGKAGPEGGRQRGGYLRRTGLLRHQERPVQGYQSVRRRRISEKISWYRAEPSTTTRCSAALRRSPAVEAVRPDIAGIMGAFGAALIARERYRGGIARPPCSPSTRSTP